MWLASEKYENAPQKETRRVHEGTRSPIDESFKSAFIGKTIEDAAEWLKNKPDGVDLEAHHFAILDGCAERDGSVVVCKIGDKDLNGSELDYSRYSARGASNFLRGMEYGEWEELKEPAINPKKSAEIEY